MIKSVGHVVVSFILCFLFHMFVALSFYAPPPENESPKWVRKQFHRWF